MNKLRYLLSIMFLFGLITFSPGASPLVRNSDVAFASSDPVIAAVGLWRGTLAGWAAGVAA